ncbi:hypothetical protein E3P92_03030 [Wallemia ichthyophaga]|uniref:RNB domain-containing protein n=2 Tax=Wallemia ichthyophaga TaxID=245174 RepID=A0A4V4M179_WALIC|nr:uncharacterized protein J056_002656 [Wallemia ichthyophaga EXF-994]TIB09914.1 hypothetical protein E3P93_03050 [Wallemia ichthyophaga]EOQ98994.1 hypothetical protein J056_002656 [Wallemia ichthyophaga EXF-994]TIB09987.1 hypothetical protein E3P90_03046 [Wallemia ichthyophaga]TIB11012.1 hypothetical protein E3P92_03030 [Wallemia ichthyophaga]TIB20734.1 hypothetical protein E3P89_03025 [Wallemia ichthyophaga]
MKRSLLQSKNAFNLQRKSAVKLINAATSNKFSKSPGLDYSNNLAGNFKPIRFHDGVTDSWWLRFTPNHSTAPGDFVYIPKYSQVGVALGVDIIDGRRVWHCLHSSGVLLPYPDSAIVHSTPLFDSSELDFNQISDIISHSKLNPPAEHHVYNPETDPFAPYKARLSSRLKRLRFDLESVQRQLTTQVNDVYNSIKHKNDMKWREYDILTLATRHFNLKQPTQLHILALHIMLYSNTTEYNMLETPSSIQAMKFGVRPATEVSILRLVHDWVNTREGRSILGSFVEKTHKLLEASSQTDKSIKSPLPLPPPLTYTPNEGILIRFITDACQTLNTPSFNPYESLCCILLKNFPQYHHVSQENWRSLAFDLLQNVGVFAPWESIHMAGSATLVPRDNHVDRQFDRLSETAIREYRSGPTIGSSGHTLQQHDILDAHRRDFGQLPVFVIDDANANELDDGVSLEEVDGEGKQWVHVHIADPASGIPHTHPLSLLAKERISSLYLPHRTVPMLPRELCREGFSLGSRTPQPVLTFSAQVDAHGALVDYDVSASIINNIHTLTYDDVDDALGVSGEATRMHGRLLDRVSKMRGKANQDSPALSHPAIPSHHLDTLRKLVHVSTQHSAQRVANGMLFWQTYVPSTSVSPLPLPSPPLQMQTLWEGRPQVALHAQPTPDSLSRRLVSQCMALGCQVASRWLGERDVPGVNRGAPVPESALPGAMEELLSQRDQVTGEVSTAAVSTAEASFTGGTLSSRPIPHSLNGCMDGYARVTSPLRRYSDLVMHYQIRSALLAHHSPTERVPWMYKTHDEMEVFLNKCRQFEGPHSRISNRVNDYWVVRELRRRHACSEGGWEAHAPLTCTITGAWKNDGAGTRSWAPCEVGDLGNMGARLVKDHITPHHLFKADIGRVVRGSPLDFQLYESARLIVKLEEM